MPRNTKPQLTQQSGMELESPLASNPVLCLYILTYFLSTLHISQQSCVIASQDFHFPW